MLEGSDPLAASTETRFPAEHVLAVVLLAMLAATMLLLARAHS